MFQFHYEYLKSTHIHAHSHTWAPLCKFYYANCTGLAQSLGRATMKRSLLRIPLEPSKTKHQLHSMPWLLKRSKVVKRHTFKLKMWLCFLKTTGLTFIWKKTPTIFFSKSKYCKATIFYTFMLFSCYANYS